MIVDLMVKDHVYLAELLNRVKEAKGKDHLLGVFDDFKWTLEKHLFIEEKAIFCFCDCINDQNLLKDLLKEHEEILNLIRQMEKDLKHGVEVDVQGLQEKIMRHKDKEEEKFYPMLDKELSSENKAKIVDRIKEF